MESESPLDEYQKPLFSKSSYLSGPPTSLSIRERRHRRDSVSRSDTSGSSAGDLGDITPCNASPHMPGLISYRAPIRDEVEEAWRRNLQSLLINQPTSHPPDLLLQLYRVIKVSERGWGRRFFIHHSSRSQPDVIFVVVNLLAGPDDQINYVVEKLDEIFHWRRHCSGQPHIDIVGSVVVERGTAKDLVQSKLCEHTAVGGVVAVWCTGSTRAFGHILWPQGPHHGGKSLKIRKE